MTCQGGVWVRIAESATNGYLGIGQTSPAAPLHVGGETIIGNTSLSCSTTTEGGIRYNSSTKVIQLCDGSTWNNINLACDVTPDGFNFTDITNATFGTTYETSIQQITGISCGIDVSISGTGTPEYRTCSDATCSTVIQNWTSSNGAIANNEYLQLRVISGSESLTVRTATVNVGGAVDSFSVTTQNLGTFKRVFMSRTDRSGGDYGGRAGADAVCQSDADAQGLGGTYYAWLSTDSTDDPESRFTRYTVPIVEIGGGTVANNWADLVDGNIGDGIANNADGSGGFSCDVWTNTNADGTAASSTDNCNGWTSDGGGYISVEGRYSDQAFYWSNEGSPPTCDTGNCILCFEQ